ncbi:DNA repair protein RadC [bacterium]|nr:DNA repair protein RadC [bacterium]
MKKKQNEDISFKAGHRKRLRDKFLKHGLKAFYDYEIIELLLTLGTPRKDCKQQAKEAVKRFKGLKGTLEASIEELGKIKDIGPLNAFGIKLFQAVAERYLQERIINTEFKIDSAKVIFDYLYQSMQKEKKELFKVFYLNNANKILEIEDIFCGTVDHIVIYPREIIKSALDRNATRLIFVHNHPSGNLKPSSCDIQITQELKNACHAVQIELLDHIIISRDGYYSFKANNLLL